MAFPGRTYAPPGVYTRTLFENPVAGALESFKIPIFIGEGNEYLTQNNLEVVRGSSSTVDQQIVGEDETGRAVLNISGTGVVTLGDFDGVTDKLQVRKFPIVDGSGVGKVSNNRSDVIVTINNQVTVVRTVTGSTGIIQLAQPPKATDLVRVTYYFKRTDTLITDDVSPQVNPNPAVTKGRTGIADVNSPVGQEGSIGSAEVIDLHGDITNASGQVIVPANNVLNLVIDGTRRTVTIPPRSDYTMAQVAAAITATRSGTLTGSSFTNNFGLSALQLNADCSIVVNDGSANAPLGLQSGQADVRTATFYTYQGPIVDGSNGGVTTTDPAKVTVKVNNVQVIPTSVDGANRAVTLPYAPKAGSKVYITYWFNAWQDTFDYLAHYNVSEVTKCGVAPDSTAYIQEADFILKDDKIVWGTASLVSSGIHTQGFDIFGENQVSTSLIDNKTFLSACTAVTESSGGVAVDSRVNFQLPFQPTLGNGRDTPLGQSLFQTVSNGRIDLPVNRPDVVDVYWGFDVQDALERGKVSDIKVEGTVVTLAEPVPVGATVYASFWYNLLTDNTYTLTCANPGVSGVGTYTVKDKGNNDVYWPSFNTGTKGASLNGVVIEFPSGSELTPDLHFEGMSGDGFVGPVEEIVTVRFASKVATPAKYTVPGPGPYEFINGYSHRLRIDVHRQYSTTLLGLDLNHPSLVATHDGGFFASLIGNEVVYTGGSGATMGQSYTIDTPESFYIQVDNANIMVKTSSGVAATNKDITYFVDVINEAASGHQGAAAAGGASTITLQATKRSNVNNYYVGWRVVLGNGAVGASAGQMRTVTAYDGLTGVATVDSPWSGGAVAAPSPYNIYNPDARSAYIATTEINGPVTIAAGKHDKLKMIFTGNVSGSATMEVTLAPASYATPVLLAAQIQTQINSAITTAVGLTPALNGLAIEVVANADAKLQFKLQLPGVDTGGYLQFLNSTGSPAADFAVLAGLDTAAAAGGGQAALLQAPIARAYVCPATIGTDPKLYDRIILRNRLLPGGGANSSLDSSDIESQTKLLISTTNVKAALDAGMYGTASRTATVRPATLFGKVGFIGGMDTDAEPLVRFYDGSGSVAANNEFSFVMDGTPVTVTFIGISTGQDTPLGPITSGTSVLGQIVAAMAAVPGTPFGSSANIITNKLVRQEGAGIRITGLKVNSNSIITIGTGSANGVLGFSGGLSSLRTTVSVRVLAAALMANRHTSFNSWLLNLGASTFSFTGDGGVSYQGMASVIEDSVKAEYLYLQDGPIPVSELGTTSAIQLRDTLQNIDNALAYNTGLNAVDGDGSSGEAALDGFFVKSSTPGGSGSVDTSKLNPSGDGTGQDGMVGQTYRDEITGLTFTILPRGWHTNPYGPWLAYPTGAAATFRFNVSKTFTTDANLPNNALNGVELKVANTSNVGVGDTAIVETFQRGGQEPAVGDLYYVSYIYQKQDFTTAFFTKMSAIEAAYGVISVDNPLTLAADMAMLNGAILLGLKQVPREEGTNYASLTTYRDAINELQGVLPGYVNPDIITPLRGDSTDLYQYLKQSNELMSSIRYKSERTSIIGVSAGTLPDACGTLAQNLSHMRMRLVYPDIMVVTITDALGTSKDELADGPMLAAMLVGSVVSPNYDVASPWTGRRLVGARQLGRILDAVEQNQLATKGVTILEDRPPFIRVRHGLTTDVSNILTKLPTIVLIADDIQQQARFTLEQFIGIKFIPGILTQVEGRLAMMLKAYVAAQIITAYTGIKATVAPDDPTVAEVEAYYSPVFPLLYLVLTFHLRSSL